MNKLTVDGMKKSDLITQLRVVRARFRRLERELDRVRVQRDFLHKWNLSMIESMSVAHAQRGIAAYRVTYTERNGKEKRKLFFTQKRANKFRDSLIPSRSVLSCVEPLYLT